MLRPEIRLLTRASGRARFQRQHVPGREPHKPTLDTVGSVHCGQREVYVRTYESYLVTDERPVRHIRHFKPHM